MPKRARILPSNTTVMTAFTQKFTFVGSFRNDSEKYWGMAKPGMFISRMPSRATPRRASTSRTRCASATGAGRVGTGLSVTSSPIRVGPVGCAGSSECAAGFRSNRSGASQTVKKKPELRPEPPSRGSGPSGRSAARDAGSARSVAGTAGGGETRQRRRPARAGREDANRRELAGLHAVQPDRLNPLWKGVACTPRRWGSG